MTIGLIQIFLLLILVAVWFGCYALGNYVCQKNNYLKKNINKNSIIILSLILFPIVMAITKEGFFFGAGWTFIGPFLLALLIHWLYPKIFKNKIKKSKNFFNDSFYYGYLGFLFLAVLNLATYF